MLLDIILGIVRTLLAAFGGEWVKSGVITNDQLQSAIGSVIVLITIGWSAWTHRQHHLTVQQLKGALDGNLPAAPEVRRAIPVPDKGSGGMGGTAGFCRTLALTALAIVFLFVLCAGAVSGPWILDRYAVTREKNVFVLMVAPQDRRPFWERLLRSLHIANGADDGSITLGGKQPFLVGGADF